MTKPIIEVLSYYTEIYGPCTIFFQMTDCYIAFNASKEALFLNMPANNGELRIPKDSILDVIGSLSQAGFPSRTITYRDDNGRFSMPDIKRLKKERDIDEKFTN